MSFLSKKLMATAATATASSDAVTVDQVFSTDVYTSNNTGLTITNGIDIPSHGGMTWFKARVSSKKNDHIIVDTNRVAGSGNPYLIPNSTAAQSASETPFYDGVGYADWNSTGFVMGQTEFGNGNLAGSNSGGGVDMVAWSFRKAPKFFDIQTWTKGSGEYVLNHSLGSVPGMVLLKRTDASQDWHVYHQGMHSSAPEDYGMRLNNTSARSDGSLIWNDTAPTSTTFTVGNQHGAGTYVAYIFADNSSEDAENQMIKCGSYTGNGSSTGPVVNLGFEPQFLMIKNASYAHAASYWILIDNMRGMVVGGDDGRLYANETNVETQGDMVAPTSTGFNLSSASTTVNRNNDTYIYMAIRRDNQAEITDATDVFDITLTSQDSSTVQTDLSVIDMNLHVSLAGDNTSLVTRLLGSANRLNTNRTSGEASYGSSPRGQFDTMGEIQAYTSNNQVCYSWTRAKSFFDVVAYTGTGSARTIPHSLGAGSPPEMIWVKGRDIGTNWTVYHKSIGETKYLKLQSTNAETTSSDRWNDTAPTDSVFTIGTSGNVNYSGSTFIAYLFATLANVSKVGSFTGTNSAALNVDCGFTNSARLVIIKRTDAAGDWYTFDSVRGIASWPNDTPYLLLNSSAAQVANTNHITAHSSGFTVVQQGSGPFSSGTFIFYAIA